MNVFGMVTKSSRNFNKQKKTICLENMNEYSVSCSLSALMMIYGNLEGLVHKNYI